MEQNMNSESEIDLAQLIKIILSKWILISVITVLMAAIGGAYAYLMLDDVYVAESSLIVQVTADESGYTNLLTGQRLVNTYSEIATSNHVLDDLRNNLGINFSNATLRGLLHVEGVKDTAIINLKVQSVDPVLATDIANELVVILKDLSTEFVGLENVEVLYSAVVPTVPSGPNRVLYIVIGGLLGGIIGVGLVLGIELFDKNIKTTKDIENILNLRILGSITEYDMEEEE